MNDSFGDFNATQTATGGAASEQKAEGIAPVLVKQIMESAETNFQMFGLTCGMVYVVGIVRNIEMSSTKITYTLEDHTGRIDAHYWLDEGDAIKAPDVMLNNYVKVYGAMRPQAGQKALMVFKLLPVLDPNELCTHLLEVLHMRYKSEELHAKLDGAGMSFSGGAGTKMELDGGGFGSQGGAAEAGLEGKHLAVFQAIKSNISQEGISRRELKSKFSHVSDSELNQILEFMISEGHIYSSIDSDHFICTI